MNTENQDSFSLLARKVPEFLAPSLAEDWPKLLVRKAQGSYLYTADGRRILDFTSGIGVTNIGHCHPRVIESAKKQMNNMIHSAVGITIHETLLELCVQLPKVLPPGLNMFFFGNSGSEAVEGAIKLARYIKHRPVIIAFEGSFHGRSYGALSITSVKSKYRAHYEPVLPGVYFAPYAYPYRCPLGEDRATEWSLNQIRKMISTVVNPVEVAAFIVEPIQGEGGYIVPPRSFLQGLRSICDEYNILLIFDEVQTGFGRTGEMFAAQVFDVQPDIMAIAKGIASGFPLGATVASKELMKEWHAGSHGTTFGGNPVACAAALATLEVIREENLLENCRIMGARLLETLRDYQKRYSFIGDVRGIGLMIALEMIIPGSNKEPNPNMTMKLLNECLERGLLGYMAGTYGNVVRFIPPLNVSANQVDEALQIIEDSLASM